MSTEYESAVQERGLGCSRDLGGHQHVADPQSHHTECHSCSLSVAVGEKGAEDQPAAPQGSEGGSWLGGTRGIHRRRERVASEREDQDAGVPRVT